MVLPVSAHEMSGTIIDTRNRTTIPETSVPVEASADTAAVDDRPVPEDVETPVASPVPEPAALVMPVSDETDVPLLPVASSLAAVTNADVRWSERLMPEVRDSRPM